MDVTINIGILNKNAADVSLETGILNQRGRVSDDNIDFEDFDPEDGNINVSCCIPWYQLLLIASQAPKWVDVDEE